MGVVYLARDPGIDREVALKTIRFDSPGASFNLEEAKERFLKEARISGRLQHPHIVTVFDVGEDEGTLYLAMEFVPGGNLAQRIADKSPFPIEDRIRIVAEVADALDHAHDRGVIHRDVKPSNILLAPSLSAKVGDFGIGKFVTGDTDLTSTGQMVGSPSYMSPEQMRGEKVDVRSDIFSLGVVLYQTMTGQKPFPGDTLTTLVYQILNVEPPAVADLCSDVPPEISGIVRKCLAKNRDDRYAYAGEVAAELGALVGISPVAATTSFSESRVKRLAEGGSSTRGRKAEGSGTVAPPPAGSEKDGPTISVRTDESAIPAFASGPSARDRKRVMAMSSLGILLVGLLGWLALRPKGGDQPPPPTQLPGLTTSPVPGTPATTSAESPLLGSQLPGAAPTPTKKPKPTAVPTPAPVPTLKPADVSYSVKHVVKLAVTPDQARVFLDGKYIGIADDWDDSGSGALLVFAKDGNHRLRFAHPSYTDLTVDVRIMSNAAEEKITIKQPMQPGVAGGSTGPNGEIKRPDYRTVGPVAFSVEPAEAVVTVNGQNLGRANIWTRQNPLTFTGLAVNDLVLSMDGYESKALRVLVSPSTAKPDALVNEKLKKK